MDNDNGDAETGEDDHAEFRFTDIIMDSTQAVWDAEQSWAMFSMSLLNRLLSPQHYMVPKTGTPLHVPVMFRFPPAPINSPPYVFKLHLSNVSEVRGLWQIFTVPPRDWKKHLRKKINRLSLTSELKDGYFTDSPDLLLPQLWAKKFNYDPSAPNELPTTLNPPKDLSLFEITPMSGSLDVKESCVLSFKYSFATVGTHQISVMLRIFPSIYVWIDLTGRTLDANQSYLQLMNKNHMTLHPVTLFDMDPPVQMFWVYNAGRFPVSYSVDLEPFEKLKDDNFDHAVIDCISPKGEVEPKRWAPIKLRFSPLEYTTYSAPLIIQTNYEKIPIKVMLHGTPAMNPALSLRPHMTSETARKFVLFPPSVPVTVSPSHITIGHLIPTGDAVSRIVFMTNLHPRNTMKYNWDSMPIEGGGMISLYPNCGRLAPKEEVSIKVTIQAGDTAAVLKTMLTCTIEDEAAGVLYEFVLKQWKNYTKNGRDTEGNKDKVNVDKVAQKRPDKPETYTRLLAVSLYIGNVFGQLDLIPRRENARMGFVASLNCKCGQESTSLEEAPLTYKGALICQSILKDIIWDLVESPSFRSLIKVATKRRAPTFEEYVDMEGLNDSTENEEDKSQSSASQQQGAELAIKSTTEILEKSIFNILHEMAERYAHSSTKDKWFEIPPVQPKAFVDVETYKKAFQPK